jgi:hypothetical protein
LKDPYKFEANIEEIFPRGMPPIPRYSAKLVNINDKYILIIGGRNDNSFKFTQTSALGDIAILNLEFMQWESVS